MRSSEAVGKQPLPVVRCIQQPRALLEEAAACAFQKMGVDVVGKIADLLGVKFAEGDTLCQTDLADRLG